MLSIMVRFVPYVYDFDVACNTRLQDVGALSQNTIATNAAHYGGYAENIELS